MTIEKLKIHKIDFLYKCAGSCKGNPAHNGVEIVESPVTGKCLIKDTSVQHLTSIKHCLLAAGSEARGVT